MIRPDPKETLALFGKMREMVSRTGITIITAKQPYRPYSPTVTQCEFKGPICVDYLGMLR